MKNRKRMIVSILCAIMCISFVTVAKVEASGLTDSKELYGDTFICTYLPTGNQTFTAYTRNLDSTKKTEVRSTAYYLNSVGEPRVTYSAIKDASLGYALLNRVALPSGGTRWTYIESSHYLNDWLLMYGTAVGSRVYS